jgi:hypothetical protein
VSTDTPAPPAPEQHRRRLRLGTALIAAGIVVLIVMWVYIYGFADTTNPNRLPDRAWATKAEAICTVYAKQIAAQPDASTFSSIKPKSEALRQRAVVGQRVTDLLTRMVADLRAAPTPTDANSAHGVQGWLADWDTYLGDRQRHLDSWAAGDDPPFTETAVKGQPISQGMDDFADANGMAACEVPQDLG